MKMGPLRYGFTTGTCAAVAAKAAAVMLLTGGCPKRMGIMTPKGIWAECSVLTIEWDGQRAVCAVKKDAGDDPDVTHGSLVYAEVCYIESISSDWYTSATNSGMYLTAGKGIGRVTRPGLSCPVGMPAINPVPRRMIFEAVEQVLKVSPPVLVTISIPDGVFLAEKTFNPKLGIEGGISILGTSGIVEPMSEQALLDTIRLEIHMKAVECEGRKRIVLVPGNYGMDFLEKRFFLFRGQAVKCSNFIADAVEMAAEEGFETIMLAGHIGKLIKVAGGAKNTHSKYGDGRMETLAACMDVNNTILLNQILSSNTTEEALGYLNQEGILKPVMDEVAKRVQKQLLSWLKKPVAMEVVTFSTVYDILGMTDGLR